MPDELDRTPWRLERYRPYLKVLARRSMRGGSRHKFDSSDVVQDALLRAHEHLDQFRGGTEPELRAWLARILRNSLVNSIEALGAKKRDAALEQSLDASLNDTSARLENWLAADVPSPSEQALRAERVLRLTAALDHLPEDQRTAIELRHLNGHSVEEIGREMGRSHPAVAGLLRRGLEALRQQLDDDL